MFSTAPFAAVAPNEAPPPASEEAPSTLVLIGGTDKVLPTDCDDGVQLRLAEEEDRPDKCFTNPVLMEVAKHSPMCTENQQQHETIVTGVGFPTVDGQVEKLADGKN